MTSALAAQQLRLDSPDERDYLNLLIDAATDYAEDAMSCSLITRTLAAEFSQAETPILGYGPVQSVTSVTDAGGAITDYALETYGNAVRVVIPKGFTAPLTVTYVAGYADDPDDLPAKFRLAILTHVATLYENRASADDKAKAAVPHSLDDFYTFNARTIPVA